MKLRKWQKACLKRMAKHYRTKRHFFCLAVPASGKTILAGTAAKMLIDSNEIDFVLCFAPTSEVTRSITATFSEILSNPFDGKVGALGGAFTYQSLQYLPESFWDLLTRYRVMVVLDEIHHCAGSDFGNANSWGIEVIRNIQNKARFTLALSGTPWRSDDAPIVLANYSDPGGKVICDFEYTLSNAVADRVCRFPKAVLIEHDQIRLSTGDDEAQTFRSIEELLASKKIQYESLIKNETVMDYMLDQACKKLDALRKTVPRAAGLVVASSINHAHLIAGILVEKFGQSVQVVTCLDREAQSIIENFRHSSDQWIVSVGMISEGTDIKRLQVCCHLSLIKTEMHFRQVFGRILRITGSAQETGWLYILAEPRLARYANQLDQEIPHDRVVSYQRASTPLDLEEPPTEGNPEEPASIYVEPNRESKQPSVELELERQSSNSPSTDQYKLPPTFDLVGKFRLQVIAAFESTFR